MKKVLTNLDMSGNSVLNLLLNPLPSPPATAPTFYVYTSTATEDKGTIYVNIGTMSSPEWYPVGAVQSVNNKTGKVVLTQDDVGDGVTYKRTHNDLTNALVSLINGALQKSGGTMSGNIAMGSNKITGLGDGTSDQDAVTKKQLDAAKLGALKPSGSVTFANLPPLSASVLNNIYNVTDAFTTTSDFVEGAGKAYPAGTNVAVINTGTSASPTYKYDAYTGVIDLSPYINRSGDTMNGALAMANNKITGLAAGSQNGDAVRYEQLVGLIKTATGTITTTGTSAVVNFNGTLINAYAKIGNAFCLVDITVGENSVTFASAQSPSSDVTCVVVYV